MPNEEKSQKPREMVHRAQAEATKWLHQLRRARQGLPKAPSPERARREYHDAVMAYWEQIKRFRSRSHIKEMWGEDIDGLELSLSDIGARRLSSERSVVEQEDPDTGATNRVQRSEPWVMSPRVALQVNDKLDECAHELGFDAEPKRQARETGAGLKDADPEDVEYLNANPMEVADGDD